MRSLIRSFRLPLAGALAALLAACSESTPPIVPGALIVAPDSVTLDVGFGAQLVASVTGTDGLPMTGAVVTYTSADTTIALVTGNGLVIGVAGGHTTVHAASGAVTTNVPVVVRPPSAHLPKTVTVSPDSVALALLGSVQLTATVTDSTGRRVLGATVTWSSADTSIATVNASGFVVARAKTGRTSVHVVSGPATTDVPIAVTPAGPVNSLTRVAVTARPFGVAVSTLGKIYATQQDANALTRIALSTNLVDGTVAVGLDPGDVTFLPSGATAYVTNFNGGTVGLVDVSAGQQKSTVSLGAVNVLRILRSRTGQRLYVTSGDGTLHIYDTTLTQVASFAVVATPNGIASKGDTLLYVSSLNGGTITEVNLQTNAVVRTLMVGGIPQDIALSADGSELYVADETGHVLVVSLPSGSVVASIPAGGGAFGLGLSSGGYLYVSLPAAGRLLVINAASRTQVASLLVGGKPRRVAFDPNGTAVVIANEGGWVDVLR